MIGSRVHLSGDITFSAPLGALCAVTPVAVPGHTPHIVASFLGGARMEWDAETAAELTKRLPEAIASLARVVDCSAIVADIKDVS